MMKKFIYLSAYELDTLEVIINKHIDEGYVLYLGTFVSVPNYNVSSKCKYVQAMILSPLNED